VEQIAREFASTSAQEAAPVRERQRDLQHQGWQTTRPEKTSQPDKDRDAEHAGMGSAGKRADDVIGWVQTHLSLPDLIAATHPEVRLRRAGQGWIGWCPFHDDEAPQPDGSPGTPSLYVVASHRYGWSWRCLSSNCGTGSGPMHHTFDWLIWCQAGSV